MNIQVVYGTISGHSRKIAKAIADALNAGCEDIKNNPMLTGVDLLFVIGGVYGSKYNEKIVAYMENINANQVKKVALIRSAVSQTAIQKENPLVELLQKKQIEVEKEEYTCRGSFLFMGCGHPNKAEIEKAVQFAKRVAASKMIGPKIQQAFTEYLK